MLTLQGGGPAHMLRPQGAIPSLAITDQVLTVHEPCAACWILVLARCWLLLLQLQLQGQLMLQGPPLQTLPLQGWCHQLHG